MTKLCQTVIIVRGREIEAFGVGVCHLDVFVSRFRMDLCHIFE
jgi:hypothetical protein